MIIDMRSTSQEELLKLEEKVLSIIHKAVEEENERWNDDTVIRVNVELVGSRPAGSQPSDAPIVQASLGATKAIGFKPELVGSKQHRF